MNKFKHAETLVYLAELRVNLEKAKSINAECNISYNVGLPKDIDSKRSVRIKADLQIGSPDDTIYIHLVTANFFDVIELESEESLRKDARSSCTEEVNKILIEKVEKLTELSFGKSITVPL